MLTSANWAWASSTAFCTESGRRTAETITCTFLKYEPPRLPERSSFSALRDRLLDLDEVGVRLVARGLVERAGGRGEQRARGDEVLALEAPDRLAQRVVEHGAELGVEERAEALVALPRMQPGAAAGDRIRAVAEARVELLHQLVVADAGEGGGERDLRLEPDVDAVGGRHAQHVDADAVAAPGRAGDDVAPRRALRRIQPRVLREPAGPGQAGGRRDQLPLRLLVQRAAVVDDADLVRTGARKAAERHEREDDHEQPEPDRTDRKADPALAARLARPAPPARQLRQLVLEGHMRNVQAACRGLTRIVASRPARVAQLVERQPSKLDVAGSRPVARFVAGGTGVDSVGSRGVAQSGSAPGWGPGGRRFKSCLPDSRKPC